MFLISLFLKTSFSQVEKICAWHRRSSSYAFELVSKISWYLVKCRVIVELGWTRARASNPRVGQGWTYPSRPSGSDGLGFLSERVERVEVFVWANYSSSHFCSTNWIEQTYLSVEHSIRISTHTKISNWAPELARMSWS
jgi:hypothetical protein